LAQADAVHKLVDQTSSILPLWRRILFRVCFAFRERFSGSRSGFSGKRSRTSQSLRNI
jgi:hypothetical protein